MNLGPKYMITTNGTAAHGELKYDQSNLLDNSHMHEEVVKVTTGYRPEFNKNCTMPAEQSKPMPFP